MGANLYNDLNSLLTLLQSKFLSSSSDVWQWKLKQGSVFTVNLLYRKLIGYRKENNYFRQIWTSQAPLKVKVHMWLSFQNVSQRQITLPKGVFSFHLRACFVMHTRRPPLIFFFVASSHWIFGCRKETI